MIILSQDRNSIVNYDNVKSIWITVMDKSEHDKDAKFFIVADSEILGGYDTEERAMCTAKKHKMLNKCKK